MPKNMEISSGEGIAPKTLEESKKIGKTALKFFRFGPDGGIELS